MIDLFVVAGEPSGDTQGSEVIKELLRLRPELKIGAVAGPRMRELSIQTYFFMENLQVMGFTDVLFALPKIIQMFFAIRKKIGELKPKAVLLIDYPGFNLRLERHLRKKGYQGKLIHFVAPTVWAWGKKRIPQMAENLDLLLTLFPFEKKCFSHTQLPVKYIGNPLVSKVAAFTPPPSKEKILGLFPGSRKTEIERNFPLQLQIARKLLLLDPLLSIHVSIAHLNLEKQLRLMGSDCLLIPPSQNYKLMKNSHLALATSGTVTLELALLGTPTVVNYAIKPIDCWLAQKIFRIDLPFYSMPNIIVSKMVFPELFGPHLTDSQFFFWAQKLWFEEKARQSCIEGCSEVRQSLGMKNAATEAAKEILELAF